MARVIDYISLTVIVFLLTLVWTAVAFETWTVALVFSAAITFLVIVTVKCAGRRADKPYSPDRLALELSLKDTEYLINLIKSTSKNMNIESGSNYIAVKNSVLIANFKFSLLSINEVSTAIGLAEKLEKKEAYIMCRGIDRRAYQALNYSNVKVIPVKIKAIFRYLKKHKVLPELKRERKKFSPALFLETVFRRSNTKNYIFTGVILLSVAFLTPLKIYYLILGSVSLFLALLTFTPIGKGSFKAEGIFDALDEIADNGGDNNKTAE